MRNIMRSFINSYSLFLIIILILFSPNKFFANEKTPKMWGSLQPGSYNVGFRTVFAYDLSRPAIPYSNWDGKLFPTSETKGRQMQINIWYPAKLTGKNKRLDFRHYIELMARQTEFRPLDKERRAFADAQFISKTNSLSALKKGGKLSQENLAILKKLKTNAFANPKPVEGPFPLIVFPNGGSPAFQSIMCEFFASHGFVVVGVALKGRDGFTEDISTKGLETAVVDLAFTIGKVLEIPQVDNKRICLIGNAITSGHMVAYQTRNSNIDCMVSLDGGLLSGFEQRLLRGTPFYDNQLVDKPLLAIYAPHPSIDPKNIEHLTYSTRYFVHFPQMSEFHFLNYGAFERFVPEIIGKPKGDVAKGFETAATVSLDFFKAHLLDDEGSLKRLKRTSVGGQIGSFVVKEAMPAPPRLTIVKDAFMKEGFEYLDRTYAELKKKAPTPFSIRFYNDMKDWLAWKRDPKYEYRFRLYQLALDSYPDSATVNYYLAYFASRTGKKDMADGHYRKALKLLESDVSPELTPARIERMRELIRKALEVEG